MPRIQDFIYVFDACALIALFNEEEGADVVAELITRADEREAFIYMNIVQVLEVYYDRIKVKGTDYANIVLQSICASSIEIVYHISLANVREAGRLKSTHKISLADSFACAEASSMSATLVTADGELKPVQAAEHINFLWFRPPKEKKTRRK
jgi:predicted nucleic acid-binding protein